MKIFELEQEIMGCWQIVDDIDMIYKIVGDDPAFSGLSAAAEDELMNMLLGIKALYGRKFQNLFHTFEDVTKEYHSQAKRDRELVDLWDEVTEDA